MKYPEHNPTGRPSKGADGRCWECGEPLVNVGEEYATCGHCNVKLVPRFPPSYLRMIASGQPYFQWQSKGVYKSPIDNAKWTTAKPGGWYDKTIIGWHNCGSGYKQERFYRLKKKK